MADRLIALPGLIRADPVGHVPPEQVAGPRNVGCADRALDCPAASVAAAGVRPAVATPMPAAGSHLLPALNSACEDSSN